MHSICLARQVRCIRRVGFECRRARWLGSRLYSDLRWVRLRRLRLVDTVSLLVFVSVLLCIYINQSHQYSHHHSILINLSYLFTYSTVCIYYWVPFAKLGLRSHELGNSEVFAHRSGFPTLSAAQDILHLVFGHSVMLCCCMDALLSVLSLSGLVINWE